MRVTGQLMLPGDHGRVRLTPGWLQIAGNRIVSVTEGHPPASSEEPTVGGPDCVITPGFIDAHVHLPQFPIIGATGLRLLEWLKTVTFPAEASWADPEVADDQAHKAIDELFAAGTTGALTFATVHIHGARIAMQACAARGLRAGVGHVLMDQNAPDELIRPANELLEQTDELLRQMGTRGRVHAVITPRFAISCSAQLMTGAGEIARHRRAKIQTHLSETLNEIEAVRELHGGLDYVEVYRRAGLVTPGAVFAHGVHLTARDREWLADSGAVIAHCPLANRFLRSGTMDRAALLAGGVRLAIGSDVGGGNERSMVRVARAMIETAMQRGAEPPSPAQAWWRITAGNAEALGWEDAGVLTEGAPADLLVIRPSRSLDEVADPLGYLMFAWDDRWLEATYAQGEQVYPLTR